MHLNSLIRVMAISTIGAAAALALAGPAWADRPGGDPAGANGTVKIDALEFDAKIHNEPHVTCEFRVKFFNFDENEHGNIVFSAQAPSGKGQELLRRDNELLSKDRASGGNPDPDEIYSFSANDLALEGLTLHPQQGYHVKLTIERIGAPGAGKHKVFWLQPCPPSTTPSSPPPNGGGGGGGGGENGGGGQLPITGTPVAAIAGTGVAIIAAGAALILLRRRYVS